MYAQLQKERKEIKYKPPSIGVAKEISALSFSPKKAVKSANCRIPKLLPESTIQIISISF